MLGIAGESGSGKSVTALSIMGLIKYPPGWVEHGELFYRGRDLLQLQPEEMRKIRGKEISMIFQDPQSSFNPIYTIGYQISEMFEIHLGMSAKEARKKAIDYMGLVGIPVPEERYNNYPHEFSGGMLQRSMIAMALSCEPSLLIADEPSTALDVTIQAQILDLIQGIRKERNLSVILITHDLGIIYDTCEKVIVMYAGEVMERGAVGDVFKDPKHPYTEKLIKAIPKLADERDYLEMIDGMVPDLVKPLEGCKFANRCDLVKDECTREKPQEIKLDSERGVKCVLYS